MHQHLMSGKKTSQAMTAIEARNWVWLMNKRQKQELAKLKTVQWDSNMY